MRSGALIVRSHYPQLGTPPGFTTSQVWAIPVSLAATQGVAFAFSSSGYSDVSIPPVPSTSPMCSGWSNTPLRVLGFPIRTSTDRRSVDTSPWLFAVTHVLHRHQAPRHPPLALCSLEFSSKKRCSCLLSNSQGAKDATKQRS